MGRGSNLLRVAAPSIAITCLAACGGGGSSGTSFPVTTTYNISATAGTGGTISPASATVNADGTATFTVTPDSGYTITSVTGCGGTLSGNTYTTGAISAGCTVTASFGASASTIGGTITGLGAATGLVLANGSDALSVPAGATSFTMPMPVGAEDTYDVTVKVHPAALDCSVAGGAGTVSGADVSNISVTCKAAAETVLHFFAGGAADGANPWGSLIQASDGYLYGVTAAGGPTNHGVVFKMTADGTESVFHSFAGGTADGAHPQGGLIQAGDGNFYGVTALGGTAGDGVVYRITPDGTETILYSFSGGTADGANPGGSLIQASDGNFYGMTLLGGANNFGVVFRITPTGNETVLRSLVGSPGGGSSLIQGSDGNLYGVVAQGGAHGGGLFFRISLGGSMTTLYSFQGGTMDGLLPVGTPVQASDGNFYGATAGGGTDSIGGTIFKITPDGAETLLYSFAGGAADGEQPESGAIQANDGNLYGLTAFGGASNDGVIYQLTPDGTETVLYSFAGGATDGANPEDGLIQASDGTLYGVTYSGGASGNGTIFELK